MSKGESFSQENRPNFLQFSPFIFNLPEYTVHKPQHGGCLPLFHSRGSPGHLLFLISTGFFHKFKTSSWSKLNISSLCNLFCYFSSTQTIMQLLEPSLPVSFISFLLVLCDMLPSPSNKFLQHFHSSGLWSPSFLHLHFLSRKTHLKQQSTSFATWTTQRHSCLLLLMQNINYHQVLDI